MGPAKPTKVLYGPAPNFFHGPASGAPREASAMDCSLWPWSSDLSSGSVKADACAASAIALRTGAVSGHSSATWCGFWTAVPQPQAKLCCVAVFDHCALRVAQSIWPVRIFLTAFRALGLRTAEGSAR